MVVLTGRARVVWQRLPSSGSCRRGLSRCRRVRAARTPDAVLPGRERHRNDDDHPLDGGVERRRHLQLHEQPFEQLVGDSAGHRGHDPAAAAPEQHAPGPTPAVAANPTPGPPGAVTPACPPIRMPATVAASPDNTNAMVRTRHTRTPANCAAVSLSPVAISVRPYGARINARPITATTSMMSSA